MNDIRSKMTAISALLLACLGVAIPMRALAMEEARRQEPGGVQVVRWSAPRPIAMPHRSTATAAGADVKFVSVSVPPVGQVPFALAFTPDHAEVAIANRDSDNVTFLDVASGTIKRTVPVGVAPVSVAITPDGRYALTADVGGNTVSVIDLATHTVTKQVAVGGQSPFAVKVTQDSRFAVVGLINDGKTSAFSVIDLTTLHETATIQTPAQGVLGRLGIRSYGLSIDIFTRFALTPDGSKIVLAAIDRAAVVVYDRATGATLGTVSVAPGPWDIDISSDGAFAVVGHEGAAGRITRIDLNTLHATSFPLPVDPFFQINRITADRRFAIVSGSSEVVFVDLQTGAVTASVPSRRANDIVLSSDGRFAFVSTFQSSVLDVAAQKLFAAAPVSFFTQLFVGAASPGAPLVAALDSINEESIYLFDFSGPAIALRAAVPSGVPPEGHAPSSVALAADGSLAVVANRISNNVAVVDVKSGVLRGLIDVGSVPLDIALTPDRAWAVVSNSFSASVSVIDVAGLRVVATLSVAAFPDHILLAPDGRTAYVFSTLDPGVLSFVALDGANSRVVATLPTVGTVSEIGPVGPYDSDSGVALSADGSVLAVCGTTSGQLQLIDAVARREIARVPVGQFPIRAALSADGSRAWVANLLGNDVTVVRRAGGGGVVQATVKGVTQPFDLWLDPAGTFVYVVSADADSPALYVLDAARNILETVIDVPSPSGFGLGAGRLVPGSSMLYVAAAIDNPLRGAMLRFALAGPETQLVDATPMSDYPADLAVSADGRTAVLSQIARDGVDIASFAPPVPCEASATELCLRGNRFAVTAAWRTPQAQTGTGQALPLTSETGLFWFFSASNLELVVKVLDGCAVNGHYWVFAGGLTNVEVALRVMDTTTGAVRNYTNRLQTPYQPIQDTLAFATCP